jgi:lincosamide and streptogramin A transport system ATP-binding/permease protein
VNRGSRVILSGRNGSGKSSIIKLILEKSGYPFDQGKLPDILDGELNVGSGLKISYINQDTSHLKGKLKDYCKDNDLDESIFLAILRQLDMSKEQFDKDISDYSEGQKKKVLIAASLLTPAHLYIWDEPLNYIDVFSRMQIEKLILQYQPTMLLVEHDVAFRKRIATEVVEL